jgi:PAS domain S-box-containing protein
VPLLNADDSVREWVGTVTDVHDKRKAEEAQRESEERFRATFEQAAVGIVHVGVAGEFLRVNEKMRAMLGYSEDELQGQTFERITHPDDLAAFSSLNQRLLKGELPMYRHEKRYLRKDGSIIWVNHTAACVRDPHGEAKYIVAIVEDVSERKRAEEQIRQLTLELEQRVLDRTAQLAATNRELEAFTYSVSHDLRAPLRHIDGYAQILQEELAEAGPKALDYIQRIRNGTRHMGQLVDDLLNLARVGRSEMVLQETDLNLVVQEVLSQLRPEMSGRAIDLKLEPLPKVACDPGLLKQVFTNLISNAIKYTRPKPHAEIRIGLTSVHGQPALFIQDNGVGFNMRYISKLFGVFQRLHRAEEFEGTGVGLATVERIIQKHGGRIWAEAEVNQGATFFFTLAGLSAPDRGDTNQVSSTA